MGTFLQEFFTSIGAPRVSARRLRIAAWVRLLGILPVLYVPTGLAVLEDLPRAADVEAARQVFQAWLLVVALLIVFNVVLLRVGGRPASSRALTYASITVEVGASLLIAYGIGILTSTGVLFLVVIAALYRVFFDYSLGMYAALLGCVGYVSVAVGTHVNLLAYAPQLPAFSHPFQGDVKSLVVVVQSVIVGVLLTFFAVNYAVNQSVRLHRYITESVLRRYLPPTLVARAAEGELRLDAEPERRVVTVMFTDIVGFTALSERLGPDQVGRLLNRYLTRMSELAHAHGATVDKFVGDAVMVVFGAPDELAPELQARQCAALALEMQVVVAAMKEDIPLQFRAGINTGEAVVGHFGSSVRSDFTVIGHTVNVAARLESASSPGRVLVGEQTAALLGGDFELEDAGELSLKNVSGKVRAHFVKRSTESHGPADVAGARGRITRER